MSKLFSLIVALFKGWLGFKQDSAIAQGKAEQKVTDLENNVVSLNAEAKAAADSPTSMEQLIKEQQDGTV